MYVHLTLLTTENGLVKPGVRSARAWFLKIVSVRTSVCVLCVCLCVCVCVCPRPQGY